VPIDGPQSAPSPQPSGYWVKTWGALATSDGPNGGISVGKNSKKDAGLSAVADCTKKGGDNCKVALSYFDQCVAILQPVSGQGAETMLSAISIEEAVKLAGPICSDNNGGAECKVVYSECTDPIFKRH
jgi:hypothetical protein